MYVTPDFKHKKELREAVKRGEVVKVWNPGPYPNPHTGQVSVEGPQSVPHTWYATVMVEDGRVVEVIA